MPRVNHVLTTAPAWHPDQHAINPHAPHQTDLLNRFGDVQTAMSRCTVNYLYLLRHVCALYPTRVSELFGVTLDGQAIQFLASLGQLDLIDMQHTSAAFFHLDPNEVESLVRTHDLMTPLHQEF